MVIKWNLGNRLMDLLKIDFSGFAAKLPLINSLILLLPEKLKSFDAF